MKLRMIVAVAATAALTGCASRSGDITASYVSSTQYQGLSCAALRNEAQTVSARAQQAAGVQDRKAGKDAAVMAVGLVVFWPALFFTSGDGASASEVAQLKGHMQAIEETSNRKGCGIKFQKG